MKKDFESQLLVQVVSELDMKLVRLADQLSFTTNLELGDDPRLIKQVELDLTKINAQVRSLRTHFDISVMPLSKANRYFTAAYHLDEALKYVQQLREKSYGSVQNTKKFLEKLNGCIDSVREINLSVDFYSEVIQ